MPTPNTLYDYYTAQGKQLPSLQDRAQLYQQYGLGSAGAYTGAADQNIALLQKLTTAPTQTPAQPTITPPAPTAPAPSPTPAPITSPTGVPGLASGSFAPPSLAPAPLPTFTPQYLPKTQDATTQVQQAADKAKAFYTATKGTDLTTKTAGEVRTDYAAITPTVAPTYTPSEQAMGIMNPILANYFTQATQAISKLSDYSSLATQFQPQMAEISGLDTQMVNMSKVINGSEQDIRSEIQNAGGFATESQIQNLVVQRNKNLILNYNSLASLRQSKVDELNMQIGLSKDDRDYAMKVIDDQLNISGTLATMQTTMQTAARDNYNNIVKQAGGYTGLAQTLTTPEAKSYAEQTLGLGVGSLSNPAWLAKADEFNAAKISYEQARATSALAAAQSPLSPDALSAMVAYTTTFGTIPAMGMNSAPTRNAFWTALGQAIGENGGMGNIATNKASMTALTSALRTQQTQYNANQTSLGTLDKQLDLLSSYADKVDRSGSPVLNKYLLYLKGQVAGDADTAALQNITVTAANEFAKILSGAAASIAGVTVSSADDARAMINANMSPAQLKTVIGLMKQEGQFRLQSQAQTIQEMNNTISQIGETGSTPSAPNITSLAQQKGFDLAGARAAGYTDDEIMSFLK